MKTTLMALMALQYLNVPYRWGGSNTNGIDCSGLVLKVLSDVGIKLSDRTAHGLYEYCLENGTRTSKECDSILFFGKPERITHVAISLGIVDGEWIMVEAGGAGSNSLEMTSEELAQKDARVRIKPVSNRKDLISSIYLPYKKVSE